MIIVYTAQKGMAKCIILSKAEVITLLVIVSIHIVSIIFLAGYLLTIVIMIIVTSTLHK